MSDVAAWLKAVRERCRSSEVSTSREYRTEARRQVVKNDLPRLLALAEAGCKLAKASRNLLAEEPMRTVNGLKCAEKVDKALNVWDAAAEATKGAP